ncbi:MAG: methyltransferase domain-containing protein [Lachnospiraceae bacterium]|nr:methyltransferase domain-containing protein [Lachnospiraceae bacterium]
MNKSELLFYDAYEKFYAMAEKSSAFQKFCKEAFGEDFSQDGFSDIKQIDMILQYAPKKEDVHILDIGCGNGKMLGYLQNKTKAYIHGFDYSEQAIKTAQNLYPVKAEFREGVIGEIEYPENYFDVIISMDTMYFANDMISFVAQIKGWLKTDGVFFIGYQEGDVIPKTENVETTELAKAFIRNGMGYEAVDITRQTYDLLKKKREAAIAHQVEFEAEGHKDWFEILLLQTECVTETYEEFAQKMTRYIFVARK